MTRWRNLLVSAFSLLAALVFAEVACATPNFPGAVQRILGADAAPQCRICHLCGITGRGTVNTPWGVAMRARGLKEFDESSLATALAAMERDAVDSDADGVIDVDAVRLGNDPNPGGLCSTTDDTIPRYGCVGQISPANPQSNAFIVFGGALLTLVVRKSRVRWRGVLLLLLTVALAAVAGFGCASGTALAPRNPGVHAKRMPAMRPLKVSKMDDELRALNLDPAKLPKFGQLSASQKLRLMSTFTRSLGVPCTGCHDASDYRAPTREQAVTVQMWNDFTRPYGLQNGNLYCDSCHQGVDRYLDRRSSEATSHYMAEAFRGTLKRHDSQEMKCETCHGESFDLEILARQ